MIKIRSTPYPLVLSLTAATSFVGWSGAQVPVNSNAPSERATVSSTRSESNSPSEGRSRIPFLRRSRSSSDSESATAPRSASSSPDAPAATRSTTQRTARQTGTASSEAEPRTSQNRRSGLTSILGSRPATARQTDTSPASSRRDNQDSPDPAVVAPVVRSSASEINDPDAPVVSRRSQSPSPATLVSAGATTLVGANALLESDIPESLDPAESAKHLLLISEGLRNSAGIPPSILEGASQRIGLVSKALDAGCSNLEPGCRFHAKLIRRNLDAVASQISELSVEPNPAKFHVAIERLEGAAQALTTLDRRNGN